MFCIGLISLYLKLFFFDFNITSDSVHYFDYASTVLNDKTLVDPDPTPLHNLGFSVGLAGIFYVLTSFGIDSLVEAQVLISFLFSFASIPIIYLLLGRYFDYRFALFGTVLYSLEPRIIQNATLGIIDPVFFFFSLCSLFLATSKTNKYQYLAFVFCGIATTLRLEGLILIPVCLILVFQSKTLTVKKTVFFILISILVIIPLPSLLYLEQQKENVIVTLEKESNYAKSVFLPTEGRDKENFVDKSINSFIYMTWATFPNFLFLIPFGLYFLIKEKKLMLILIPILLLSSGFWAYFDAHDTRYFIPAFPFLTIISLYGLKLLIKKFNFISNKNTK